MIGIYKITNPQGKIYIGQSINIERRFKNYKSSPSKSQLKIYRSLQKYGFDQHQFEIIEECSLEQLDKREIYWGNYYDVLGKNGLCLVLGKGVGIRSEETKQKIRENNLGKSRHTEEHKKEVGRRNLGNKFNLGKKRSQETKDKISKANKGNKFSNESRIKMSNSAKGKIKTEEHKQKIGLNHSRNRPVIQKDLNNNIIKEFISISEAARNLRINYTSITACCTGRNKTGKGYKWEYKILNELK